MIKRIKNNTTSEIIIQGQSIFPSEYYTIQSNEVHWFSDTELIGLITNGEIIVNNGNEDFTDPVIGLKYLTDDIPREVLTKSDNTYSLQTNAVHTTVTAGQVGILDFKLENYLGENYSAKYVKGGTVLVKNAEFGDWIEIDIIDKENLLGYGLDFLLKKYCIKMYIMPNTVNVLNCPFAPGRIPCGFYLRAKYHSASTQDVDVYLNLQVFTNDGEMIG
jgi:hypothetical protein